jgi:phage gpG-like protein
MAALSLLFRGLKLFKKKSLKIKVNKDFNKVFKKVRKKSIPKIKKHIKKTIITRMEKGLSPVRGKGRFQVYSNSYKEGIREGRYSRFGKGISPVNLKLSGKLHRSIKTRITKNGASVWFTDKKAKWHNEGTAEIPARRFVPIGKESFAKPVIKEIEKILAKEVKRQILK